MIGGDTAKSPIFLDLVGLIRVLRRLVTGVMMENIREEAVSGVVISSCMSQI
jgi:hypothetical protein